MPDQPEQAEQPEQAILALSVGELIRAAERESESLLATAGPADALALIRGWPHVLDGARQLLEAIPLRASDAGDDVNNPQHLTTRVIGMQRQTERFRPVSAAPHPSMTDAAHNLDEAADLIRRLAPKHLITAAAQGDANAVRVRVARTLANLAHVTGREIRTYSAVVDAADRANAGGRDLAKTLSSRSTDQWLQTVQRHEEMVLGYVNTHRRQLHHEQHAAPFPPSSLGMQLAAWSTTAIRRVSDPQVGANDLRRVAQMEAWVLRVAAGFTAIAGIRGELEPAAVPHIQRRLEEASGQWATVHSQWRLIQTPDRRNDADRTVLSAARALATTVESVTASVDGWRTPAQINAQLAGTPIPPLLRTITEGSRFLAETYAQLPDELTAAGRVQAPAVALLAISRGDEDLAAAAASLPRYLESLNGPGKPLSLVDITSNRLHPPGGAAVAQLRATGSALNQAAHTAHTAILVNTPTPPLPPRARMATPPAHHHQERRRGPASPGITP